VSARPAATVAAAPIRPTTAIQSDLAGGSVGEHNVCVLQRKRYTADELGSEFTDEFEVWWSDLGEDDQDKVTAAVETRQEHGPNLKRPIVGKIETSRHSNMKEFVPPASNMRILFAFDPAPRQSS
jgi:hypothetical protein